MKAYCYGREITEVVGYIEGGLLVFRAADEKYNMIGMLEDVEIVEE